MPSPYCNGIFENAQRLLFKYSTMVFAISNRPSSTTPFRKPGIFTFLRATATSKISCSSSVKAVMIASAVDFWAAAPHVILCDFDLQATLPRREPQLPLEPKRTNNDPAPVRCGALSQVLDKQH